MSKEHFNLTDKVVVITNSARGLGKAIALGLANAGASIVIGEINHSEVEENQRSLLVQ